MESKLTMLFVTRGSRTQLTQQVDLRSRLPGPFGWLHELLAAAIASRSMASAVADEEGARAHDELAPGIRRLGPGMMNNYLIEEGGEVTIVDAGIAGQYRGPRDRASRRWAGRWTSGRSS